jgi:hypothetical protein
VVAILSALYTLHKNPILRILKEGQEVGEEERTRRGFVEWELITCALDLFYNCTLILFILQHKLLQKTEKTKNKIKNLTNQPIPATGENHPGAQNPFL